MDPQYYCGRLDGLYTHKPYGVTERTAYESDREGIRYDNIFDSPNAANAVVFSRWASDAGKDYDMAKWLDMTAAAKRWQGYCWDWLCRRYGLKASPLLARVLDRTPQIIHRIFGGLWTGYWHPYDILDHTTVPLPLKFTNIVSNLAWPENDLHKVISWLEEDEGLKYIGWSRPVAQKAEALKTALICRDEIMEEGPGLLYEKDMEDLGTLFEQLVIICRGDLVTGRISLSKKGPAEAGTDMGVTGLEQLAVQAEETAAEASGKYGEAFFGGFPKKIKEWAL